MRLQFEDDDQVRVATPADEVHAVLSEPVELLALFGDLLDPSSRPHRWVGPELHAGRHSIATALDIAVEAPTDEQVRVRGHPVEGHVPAHLDIDLDLRPGGPDGALLVSRWRFRLEVPGPQVLARTLHPVVARSSRRTTREIRERLVRRFGAA